MTFSIERNTLDAGVLTIILSLALSGVLPDSSLTFLFQTVIVCAVVVALACAADPLVRPLLRRCGGFDRTWVQRLIICYILADVLFAMSLVPEPTSSILFVLGMAILFLLSSFVVILAKAVGLRENRRYRVTFGTEGV